MLNKYVIFLEEITKWVDLDFHKMFDKVPHQRLLLKLNY